MEQGQTQVTCLPPACWRRCCTERMDVGNSSVKASVACVSAALGLEQPDYDLDSEDEVLLSRLNKRMEIQPVQFETMMDRLEKASTQRVSAHSGACVTFGPWWWAWLLLEVLLPAAAPHRWLCFTRFCFSSQPVSLSEARLLLGEDDYLLKAVFDYWLRKRKSCVRPSLIPHVQQERRDGSTNGDAYVAFRRRREKMQTRKVSDQLQVLRSSTRPGLLVSVTDLGEVLVFSSGRLLWSSVVAVVCCCFRPHPR